ncbi:type II toxin-antitoxin system VapC family toxin, partial [Acinetobacter baumannii]
RPIAEVLPDIARFDSKFMLRTVPIGEAEATIAVEAQQRYGKASGHPAQLNMGDCFAYACARTNKARLLYKGSDFAHTDMA